MASSYDLCSCKSGKKFKFCCYQIILNGGAKALSAVASQWPILACIIKKDWQELGIFPLYVIRTLPNGNYIVGSYLIDSWCLGIKNADLRKNIDEKALVALLELFKSKSPTATIDYEQARTLILGSCKYAATMGFEPHSDWQLAQCMVEPNRSFDETYQFGRDGKPFYFVGPYDGKNIPEYKRKVIAAGGSWSDKY